MELNGISDEEIIDDETENAFKEVVTKRAKLRLEHKLKRHQTSKNVHKPTLEGLKKALPKGADI